MENHRVACLYRVSTKNQLDVDDIPMQKLACYNFIESKKNWTLSKEYYERGVSGYKKSAKYRNAIAQIKKDALNKEYDILLVYMFDRLGRREDETPFLIEELSRLGVEIWSTQEGKVELDSHVDRLINYIRFWHAEHESVKTAIRVDTKHTQIVKEGLFRGGAAPFGYNVIPSGKYNKKGKEVGKLQINEEQAKTVKKIFDLVTECDYGNTKIAKILNDNKILPAKRGEWNSNVIGVILKNPIYCGHSAYGKKRSIDGITRSQPYEQWIVSKEINNQLAIIDEVQWREVQTIKLLRKEKFQAKNKASKPLLLFIGRIYCGYCNSPLTTTYYYKFNKVTSNKEAIAQYRCSGKSAKGKECLGQTVYKAELVEKKILDSVLLHLKNIFINEYLQRKKDKAKEITYFKKEHYRLKREYEQLTSNVLSCLLGNAEYTSQELSSQIEVNRLQCKVAEERVQHSISYLRDGLHLDAIIENWGRFNELIECPEKKIVLENLIPYVLVYREYVEIDYNNNLHDFVISFISLKMMT